ncbi:MAG: antibiotic biosynthesis monooxygenase [Actinomycetota bacterium]
MTTTLPVAFVAKIVARADRAAELAELLSGAVELANAEEGTTVWFAVRSDDQTFWIFDAFPNTEARDAHAAGQIVAALGANADLLAEPPEINPADVLAMKMP